MLITYTGKAFFFFFLKILSFPLDDRGRREEEREVVFLLDSDFQVSTQCDRNFKTGL